MTRQRNKRRTRSQQQERQAEIHARLWLSKAYSWVMQTMFIALSSNHKCSKHFLRAWLVNVEPVS